MKCARPGCDGAIVDAYCDDCGMAPGSSGRTAARDPETEAIRSPRTPNAFDGPSLAPPADTSIKPSASTTTGTSSTTITTSPTSSHRRIGTGLVSVPRVAIADPEHAVLTNPQVPERSRYCTRCEEPVGRSRGGEPGRAKGFCRKCAAPFSFEPKLVRGDLVAGQYEVVGCLAHGGMGWVYLARDRKVSDRYVALKGLLDTGNESARAAAVAERRFLAEVEHPNIVKIHNFVDHDGDDYIVMEFVNGVSLRSMLEARRDANGGVTDPLPVGEAIVYCLEVLPALGYLHELGLAFCDFKPDNVIRTAHSLKLIDLGGVFRMGSDAPDIFGTPGYQAPEIAHTGPTVASDLFTVGRALAVLCTSFPAFQSTYRYALPPASDEPLYSRFDSLYRFLERATAFNPGERFRSAAEMADQLQGVLCEIAVSIESSGDLRSTERAAPRTSTTFTPQSRGANDRPDGRRLPVPLVDPEDPHAGMILTLSAAAPSDVVRHVDIVTERSVELDFWRLRALLSLGHLDGVRSMLDAIQLGDPCEWRVDWYRGIAALIEDRPAEAVEHFGHVHRWLPGELAPKLAMAMAAERVGDHAAASRWYETVSRTDPAFTSASFGLARCRLALGDEVGAVAAFERVPETSSGYVESRVRVVEVLLASHDVVTLDDAHKAAAIIESLELDAEQRDRLSVRVLEAALHAVAVSGPQSNGGLFGSPVTERDLRIGLERTYRALARRVGSTEERTQLVDHANRLRPRTWL